MTLNGTLMIILSLVVFIIYLGNVTLGAMAMPRMFDIVGEMMVMMTSAIIFVAGILMKEAEAARKSK